MGYSALSLHYLVLVPSRASNEIEIDENAKEFYKAVQADVKLLNYMEEHLRMEFDYALLNRDTKKLILICQLKKCLINVSD